MARIWQLFRNPLKISLLYQGAPASDLAAINRWKLELRQAGTTVFTADSNLTPTAFNLDVPTSTLSVDFSVLPSQPPAGRYNIRLYSYDPSNPAPLMWSDGDLTVEVRT